MSHATEAREQRPSSGGKRLATLCALAALQGISVYELANERFLVCRWGLSREVPDLDALARFLACMGVGHDE